MKCDLCKRKFKDNDEVVPILRFVVNERRGSWVTSQGHRFIHAHHLKEF